MASIRKIEAVELAAYAKYTEVVADLVLVETQARGQGIDTTISDEVARLRRRAAAYRTQWDAAARRLEEALRRDEVAL